MKKILMKHNIPTPQNYLYWNLGLSLSDHYWICPLDHPIQWKEINLFENDFKDEIGELQFSEDFSIPVDIRKRTTFYPSASLQGELRKKWVIQDGNRYLIKGNYGNTSQQSINEVIATRIHEKQGKVSYTEYKLCEIDVKGESRLGCICKDFANERIEFISAYDIVSSVKKRNDRSEYEHFIHVCVSERLREEDVRCFLEYQILSDFIITNTDRHFNNFGILRDSETLEFVGMAPIFDSGNSFFWDRPNLPVKGNLLDIPVTSITHINY